MFIKKNTIIVTAGTSYIDIDAYACSVAMAELLRLSGLNAVAYSNSPCNYSVCDYLVSEEELIKSFPFTDVEYVIVDVSDPEFIKENVPLDKIVEVYDHHVGFESYWGNRIGTGAHIEFIGACATLIVREWKKYGCFDQISRSSTLLLIAAILDNTLYLTSNNTTDEDIAVFNELCLKERIDETWCASYFAEVQKNVEADLCNALFNDMKRIRNNLVLPERVAQLCVWDSECLFKHLDEMKDLLRKSTDSWMINVIDIQRRCSYFVCDDEKYQKKIEKVFDVSFENGIAKTKKSYLRKEIIKKTLIKGGSKDD